MSFHTDAVELVKKMTLDEKLSQLRYDSPAIERLKIPAYNWWNEGLHGVARSGTATVFPQAIGMAASFNPDLLNCVATAISDEARAKYNGYKLFGSTGIYQGLTYWSPNINIFRDPRWGRGHETYGEDPYLTGRMGCAFIDGLQGDDPTWRKLDATIKHFAVHSGPEATRHEADVEIDRETMDDTYLWAFRYCIEHADPSAVMGAYNRVNGEPCCASETLLQKILREEWDYRGYVVSDCGAIHDINAHHHVTFTDAESAAMALNAGCILNCGFAFRSLKEAYDQGLITDETVDAAVTKLFEARFRLGMFAEKCPYDLIPMDVIECDEHRALNRRMAEESVVLLKNNGILPLKGVQKLAVIGPNADHIPVLLGNYNGYPSRYSTFLRGLQDNFEGEIRYSKGCHHYIDSRKNPWMEDLTREAVLAAKWADAVVLFMGLDPSMEGEEGDAFNGANAGDKADLQLPDSQKRLWKAVLAAGKPVIFVNVSGSAVDLHEQKEKAAALLQVFYPGAEGGQAVADILIGKVNPSGKLPVTFYKSEEDLPPFDDYRMEGRTYRFFKGEPLYSFGYGLSYTAFAVEDVSRQAYEQSVSFTVRNTGERAGMCTVLCYLTGGGRDDLNKALAGFVKTHLNPGESRRMTVELCPEILERFPRPEETEVLVEV